MNNDDFVLPKLKNENSEGLVSNDAHQDGAIVNNQNNLVDSVPLASDAGAQLPIDPSINQESSALPDNFSSEQDPLIEPVIDPETINPQIGAIQTFEMDQSSPVINNPDIGALPIEPIDPNIINPQIGALETPQIDDSTSTINNPDISALPTESIDPNTINPDIGLVIDHETGMVSPDPLIVNNEILTEQDSLDPSFAAPINVQPSAEENNPSLTNPPLEPLIPQEEPTIQTPETGLEADWADKPIKKRKKDPIITISVLLIIVAIIGVSVYFLINSDINIPFLNNNPPSGENNDSNNNNQDNQINRALYGRFAEEVSTCPEDFIYLTLSDELIFELNILEYENEVCNINLISGTYSVNGDIITLLTSEEESIFAGFLHREEYTKIVVTLSYDNELTLYRHE